MRMDGWVHRRIRGTIPTWVPLTLVALIGSGLIGIATVPLGLSAQGPELADVRTAIDDARFPEARALLEDWWESEERTADRPSLQEALWLRALLTPDPQMAELDYRRLVIEFPGGPYSDGALLRLAQGAEARGEPEPARRYLEILVRDYPRSPHRAEARDRMARLASADEASIPERELSTDPVPELPPTRDPPPTEPPPTEPPLTVDPPTRDTTIVSTDPGVSDPVGGQEADADSVRTDEPAIGGADPDLRGSFTVQLGAFSTRERAMELATRAVSEGLSVRLVQVEGSVLYRVRLGAFESRADAERAAAEPRGLGFEALVSTDRESEHTPEGRERASTAF